LAYTSFGAFFGGVYFGTVFFGVGFDVEAFVDMEEEVFVVVAPEVVLEVVLGFVRDGSLGSLSVGSLGKATGSEDDVEDGIIAGAFPPFFLVEVFVLVLTICVLFGVAVGVALGRLRRATLPPFFLVEGLVFVTFDGDGLDTFAVGVAGSLGNLIVRTGSFPSVIVCLPFGVISNLAAPVLS
jgi:hypothetical protein